MGALSDLLSAEYGRDVTFDLNPDGLTVLTASPTSLVVPNDDRLGLLIVNLSANDGRILPTASVTTSLGIPVNAGGGTVFMGWREDGPLVGLGWFGINQNANGTWLILEIRGLALPSGSLT